MKNRIKFTTVALNDNQHLKAIFNSSVAEIYCEGYTNGKRDKSIDGHYFLKELREKNPS